MDAPVTPTEWREIFLQMLLFITDPLFAVGPCCSARPAAWNGKVLQQKEAHESK